MNNGQNGTPNETYLGLTGSQIQRSDLTVDSADAAGYFVKTRDAAGAIPGPSFTAAGIFGETICQSNTAFNFDRATVNFVALDFEGTSINYKGNFMSGNSLSKLHISAANDARFQFGGVTNISNLIPITYSSPRMVGDSDMEVDVEDANGPSIVLSAGLTSTITSSFGNTTAQQKADGYISDVSPIIDLQKCKDRKSVV